MFSHIMVGANDVDASKKFYDGTFKALGGREAIVDQAGRLIYPHKQAIFMVTKPIDGNAASHANGGTIGFTADTQEQVDAWHAAGVASGGAACENPPGWRTTSSGELYLAYLRDPAGNKLCALYRAG